MRNFASPSRYIQGENALFENAKTILELGSHPVLLCDSVVYDIVGQHFEEYLVQNILRLVVRKSPTGESTHYFFVMLK